MSFLNFFGIFLGCLALLMKCLYVTMALTPSCRWVDISTWTPTPLGCLYLGHSPSVLDNSFFTESVRTSYNFLASLQLIFNLENGQLKFLDNFLSIIYYLFSAGESCWFTMF